MIIHFLELNDLGGLIFGPRSQDLCKELDGWLKEEIDAGSID